MADNKENNAPVTTQEVEEFSFSLPTEEEIKQILDAREEEKADEKDMMKTLQQQERELTEFTANMRKQLDEQMVYLRMRAGNITAGSVSLEQAEVDGRSVHVANVDYSAKVAELEQCFKECGQIKRITIPVDKFRGRPKGFAYVEFVDKASAQKAVALTGSQLHGRVITVVPKRSNVPGMSTTTRGRVGRGAYRGGNAANSRGGFVASRGKSRGGFVASRGGYSTTSRGGYATSSRGGHATSSSGGYTTSSRGGYATRSRGGYATSSRGGYATSSRGGYATSSRGAAAMHLPSSLFKGLGGKGAKGGFVKNVLYVPY